MKLFVEFTGQLQSAMGRSHEQLELPPGSNVLELVTQLANKCSQQARPHLMTDAGRIQPSLLVAINKSAFAADQATDKLLQDGDTVVFLPPISGG